MTTAVDVLNEFFSPTSKEKLWVMQESDDYTKLVRDWAPVQALEYGAVIDLYSGVKKIIRTDRMWKPTIEASKSAEAGKWYGNNDIIWSPTGTDPSTCKKELARYFAEKALSKNYKFHSSPTC